MCGIVGIYAFNGTPADADHVRQMADAVAHRGPDGLGQHVKGRIGLGHRRLSIIDLEGGHQPMSNDDESIVVIFNGEIYNFIELRAELERAGHQFRSRSDTEVIVHAYKAWGMTCVSRFTGIFAFALWDARKQRLFLARDHLGVKPLYYTKTSTHLLFGSEVKALLAHPECPRRVDVKALGQLFTFRYVVSPRTMFDGICKLPPGHYMTVDSGGIEVKRYWQTLPMHRSATNERQIADTYADLVEDAVRLQLRSDVPVGLFLSSGVDSAALLALMRQRSTGRIHTFTIGFEGGERTNETSDARALSQRFSTDHSEMIVTASDYEAYFDRYMGDVEEPVGNETAAAFYFVSRLASHNVKVVLTGQGADEPWAGYDRHLGARYAQLYQRLPRALTHGLLRRAVMALPRSEKLKRAVFTLDEPDTLTRLAKIYSFFTPAMRAELFNAEQGLCDGYADYGERFALAHLQRDVSELDDVSQMLYIDTRASLPDDLLMVNDKMSMANSIESRVPYLDHRLVEFVESLPSHFKLRRTTGKYLHKQAMERWLPREIVHRKKKGFDNPVQHWLREHMAARVDELLFSAESAVRLYFNMQTIQRLVAQHRSGRENHMRQIYLLISFEMWHRRFMNKTA